MRLTVMVPTLPERREQFERLMKHLEAQQTGEVQIISNAAPRKNKPDGMDIGQKRQVMLELALGEYVVGIDDDDEVPDDYIPTILKALETRPDCVGFLFDCRIGGEKKRAIVSNRYSHWENNKYGWDYVRTPHHLVPIKREHALAVGFKSSSYGEDADFSLRLKQSGLLKTEVFIPKMMYIYHYSPKVRPR